MWITFPLYTVWGLSWKTQSLGLGSSEGSGVHLWWLMLAVSWGPQCLYMGHLSVQASLGLLTVSLLASKDPEKWWARRCLYAF